jgi:hypothetical protein
LIAMPDSYGKRQRDAVKARRRRRVGLEIAPWEAEEQAPVAGQVAEGDEGGEEADLDSANEHHAIDSQ